MYTCGCSKNRVFLIFHSSIFSHFPYCIPDFQNDSNDLFHPISLVSYFFHFCRRCIFAGNSVQIYSIYLACIFFFFQLLMMFWESNAAFLLQPWSRDHMNKPHGWFYSMKEFWSMAMISILELSKTRDHSKPVKTIHFSSSVIQAPWICGRVFVVA